MIHVWMWLSGLPPVLLNSAVYLTLFTIVWGVKLGVPAFAVYMIAYLFFQSKRYQSAVWGDIKNSTVSYPLIFFAFIPCLGLVPILLMKASFAEKVVSSYFCFAIFERMLWGLVRNDTEYMPGDGGPKHYNMGHSMRKHFFAPALDAMKILFYASAILSAFSLENPLATLSLQLALGYPLILCGRLFEKSLAKLPKGLHTRFNEIKVSKEAFVVEQFMSGMFPNTPNFFPLF